ncbi:MAG: hypothetical protein K2P58_01370 [Hyphomonadaceae bacterium]|nr:hypothetical protein [Hyphomonadaceae bacterium]
MKYTKRAKLTDKQRLCLQMLGSHGLVGSFTEFARPEARRTMHQLHKKKLVQWMDGRWILTKVGHYEWTMLLLEKAHINAS